MPNPHPAPSLRTLVPRAAADFRQAGFAIDDALLRRFVAALIAKRFLILTGQTGSGKTKLAQLLGCWLSSGGIGRSDPFAPGSEIPSGRISYYVAAADSLAVEFLNGTDADAIRVVLPRAMIAEWAAVISENAFTRATPPRAIREIVSERSHFSPQLHSFETHLKAAAFALIDHQSSAASETLPTYRVVSVGADWNSTEHVLGYPDALDPHRYVGTPALDLILQAAAAPGVPHFLILDEMNMSHVERYFSDFLSAMESGEPIALHTPAPSGPQREGAPAAISLPDNLFIIGTVNVDETTYLFSPKVLDRANCIEFRTTAGQLSAYLADPAPVDLRRVAGRGADFGDALLATSRLPTSLDGIAQSMTRDELELLFRVLSEMGHEFGLRTAWEVTRFVRGYLDLAPGGNPPSIPDVMAALDAQVYQKVLPRLNGTRAQLDPVLRALHAVCAAEHRWSDDRAPRLLNAGDVIAAATLAAKPRFRPDAESETILAAPPAFPMSLAKIERMQRAIEQSGFTSFAEG